MQAPSWTEYLCCMICRREYEHTRPPVSLSCGHSVCRPCLELLQRGQCPFDSASIQAEIEVLPVNFAMLRLVGRPSSELISRGPTEQRNEDFVDPLTKIIEEAKRREAEKICAYLGSGDYEQYERIRGCVERLSTLLCSPTGGSTSNSSLSRPMYRKLVSFVQSQPLEAEGRARTMRLARSVGERVCTELLLLQQNQHSVVHDLWAALRQRGCQFLGHVLQEKTLKFVVLALTRGSLQRKVLVQFVVQRLEPEFPSISKTYVGHVIQLLYRASCFNIEKKTEGEVSQLALKEELRNYEPLRREHDTQVVQIAMEAGLRITPEYYSQLLYGDNSKRSHMQSIIDKLTTADYFQQSVEELVLTSQKSGPSEADQMAKLRHYFKLLAAINPSPDVKDYTMSQTAEAVDAVLRVTFPLVNHPKYKSWVEQGKKLPGSGKSKQKSSSKGTVVTLHQGSNSSNTLNATGESSARAYDRHAAVSASADHGMNEFLVRHSHGEASSARRPTVDVAGQDQMSDLVGRCPRSSSYKREISSQGTMYNHVNTGVAQQGMLAQSYTHARPAGVYSVPMEAPAAMVQHSARSGMPMDPHTRQAAAHPHYASPMQGDPYHIRVSGYPSTAEHSQPRSASNQAYSHMLPPDAPSSGYRPPVAHSREVDYHQAGAMGLVTQRHDYTMPYHTRPVHQYPVQNAQPVHNHPAVASAGVARRDYPSPAYPQSAPADMRAAIQAADTQLPFGFRLLNLDD